MLELAELIRSSLSAVNGARSGLALSDDFALLVLPKCGLNGEGPGVFDPFDDAAELLPAVNAPVAYSRKLEKYPEALRFGGKPGDPAGDVCFDELSAARAERAVVDVETESRPSSLNGFNLLAKSFPDVLPNVVALPAFPPYPSLTDRRLLILPLRLYPPPRPSSIAPSIPADNTPDATVFRSTIGARPLFVFRRNAGGPINPPNDNDPVVLRIDLVDMREAFEFFRPPSRNGLTGVGGAGVDSTGEATRVVGKGILSVVEWLRELGRVGGTTEGIRWDC